MLSKNQFAHHYPVTAAFGIASLPDAAVSSPEGLLRAADESLRATRRERKALP